MKKLELSWILAATKGTCSSPKVSIFSGLGTDTRTDLSGQLFIALKGESFDAHDFLEKAVQQGAAGVMIHQESPAIQALKDKLTVIRVGDTLKALQAMGLRARRDAKAKIIGITGSNGKTTTKEFTAAVISNAKNVHYSKGSFNNHWGVPFTLLQIQPETEVAVVEMGMNHAGEITELVHMAEPDVVMVTMVGRAHIEHFGTVEGIAAAKEEIYRAAAPSALRVYNLDNPWTKAMWDRHPQLYPKSKTLTFSSVDQSADVFLQLSAVTMRDLEVEGHFLGEVGKVRVPVFGAQNLTNLMAAAAAALAVGLEPGDVWQGLERCRTAWGRNQFVKLQSGAEMIFDAYNANPDSMSALLENMKLLKNSGRKVAVFGQMRELGEASAQFHEELGQKAGKVGFHEIYFVGADQKAFAKGLSEAGYSGPLHLAEDYNEGLGETLSRGLKTQDIVMVKGSRGMKLERFVKPCHPLDFGTKES